VRTYVVKTQGCNLLYGFWPEICVKVGSLYNLLYGFGRRWLFLRFALWVLAGDCSLDDLLCGFWSEIVLWMICYMGSGRRWFFGRFAMWVLAGDGFFILAMWVLAGDAICYVGFGRRYV
ncbi:hypothetical protein LINPERHAP2_LOCUS44244, partial [Linum perenne]